MTEITLPIPHKKLSPNARCHWAIKAKHKKNARQCAQVYSSINGVKRGDTFAGYRMEFTFNDRCRRDKDNAIASCKAYLDGIADACGQDDNEWEFFGVKFMEPDKNNPHVKIIMLAHNE